MGFEERRQTMRERDSIRKINREKVSKQFNYTSGVEDAKITIIQKNNGINFTIFRKAYNQKRGTESSFSLSKEEVKELRDYLNKSLDNWDEWNELVK